MSIINALTIPIIVCLIFSSLLVFFYRRTFIVTRFHDYTSKLVACPICQNKAGMADPACNLCNGHGKVRRRH